MHQPRPQIASPGRGRFAGTPGGVSGAEGYAGWGPRGPEVAISLWFLTYCQRASVRPASLIGKGRPLILVTTTLQHPGVDWRLCQVHRQGP